MLKSVTLVLKSTTFVLKSVTLVVKSVTLVLKSVTLVLKSVTLVLKRIDLEVAAFTQHAMWKLQRQFLQYAMIANVLPCLESLLSS